MSTGGFGWLARSRLTRRLICATAMVMYTYTTRAPDELTRKSNTACGASVAATMPRNPAAEPMSTEPTGTRRALSLPSSWGASPRYARMNSSRELTEKAEFKQDKTAVRMMMLMTSPAHGTCMVLSASVNGDSPERTLLQGVTETMKKIETT